MRGLVALLLGAILFGAALPLAPGRPPQHEHSAADHHGPLVGGPTTTRSASLPKYFGPSKPDAGPTKGIGCDEGSRPEDVQGKVPAKDYESGRAAKGYYCNARLVSHFGSSGGYRVERYVDKAGNECAFWDTTLLWPHNVPEQPTRGPGVYVMDMSNPDKPVHTDTLRTAAMQSPHESVRLNTKRGLLVAVMGYPTFQPGFIDVYDVSKDCRYPEL
ncbi:MAG: hypothetical protein ACLGHL_09640, partial [Actinomycetota bacterium]